jgi:hypothetical protein
MVVKLKEYYKVINNEYGNEGEQNKDPEEELTPFEKLAKKMEKELNNAPSLAIDFPDLLKTLDRELPKMPPLPHVEPEYTGKYDKNFAITIGKQPPPEPVEKDDKPKGGEKKRCRKEG